MFERDADRGPIPAPCLDALLEFPVGACGDNEHRDNAEHVQRLPVARTELAGKLHVRSLSLETAEAKPSRCRRWRRGQHPPNGWLGDLDDYEQPVFVPQSRHV